MKRQTIVTTLRMFVRKQYARVKRLIFIDTMKPASILMTKKNKVKKVLLVGSSFSAVPILSKLKKRALNIAICGGIKQDPCHKLAQSSYFVDYSDKEALFELVNGEGFDYIVPSCNDFSYLSCAWVAEQIGFPGYDTYETTLTLHTKDAFRSFTEANGFPVPKSQQLEESSTVKETSISFPALLKPVDSFSGRGVTKIMNGDELEDAVQAAISSSRSQKAVIEKFVEGSLHSHSVFIRDGQFAFETFADEFCTVYPYQVNCSNIPSALSKKLQRSVRECMLELVRKLNLTDGLLHTQFIADGDDFWLIECMRRAPGDLYGKMVVLSTGVDYTDLFVQPFLNEKLPTSATSPLNNYYARHTISVAKQQIFSSFSQQISSSNIQIVPLKNSGEILDAAPYDKLGILFAEFSDIETLASHTAHLAEQITIE